MLLESKWICIFFLGCLVVLYMSICFWISSKLCRITFRNVWKFLRFLSLLKDIGWLELFVSSTALKLFMYPNGLHAWNCNLVSWLKIVKVNWNGRRFNLPYTSINILSIKNYTQFEISWLIQIIHPNILVLWSRMKFIPNF